MLKVVFEDDDLIVFDKPPGLVVTSSETHHEKTLEDILHSEYKIKAERSGVVHRLDKDTSGLMVAAKTQEALEDLQSQFKGRLVKKEYLALVHGFVSEKGRVEEAIVRNPADREKFIVQPRGAGSCEAREAVTEYEPVEKLRFTDDRLQEIFSSFSKIQIKKLHATQYNLYTLLRCKPLTGRTHQIRVHLKYIHHPIVGDDRYGGRKTVRVDRRWCPRQFLHAAKLEFCRPRSGKRMSFESKLPEDLGEALSCLEKVN